MVLGTKVQINFKKKELDDIFSEASFLLKYILFFEE